MQLEFYSFSIAEKKKVTGNLRPHQRKSGQYILSLSQPVQWCRSIKMSFVWFLTGQSTNSSSNRRKKRSRIIEFTIFLQLVSLSLHFFLFLYLVRLLNGQPFSHSGYAESRYEAFNGIAHIKLQ